MFVPDNFHFLSTPFPQPGNLHHMAKKISQLNIPTKTDAALPEADYQHPQFEAGQRVRDVFGRVHEVAEQVGCAVYLKGQAGWVHPAKLFSA